MPIEPIDQKINQFWHEVPELCHTSIHKAYGLARLRRTAASYILILLLLIKPKAVLKTNPR